ncbi:hypothetical protein [Rachiplusia nu nucleopolyhedrovirus]|uniref:Uncharacterized protein n=1 Tax=Rachiplusia nu nucleopolyhedrovirus TaxID=2605775 RepID=A0AAE6IRH4_9ABAC|nr:hypothetical protein QKQ55_gp108 [Rachiplusia nu nucleopolyhedrovirus]QEI03693.1 hypothetical protein [Rachiplusia nu nucleopolyhedrovirus]
MDTVLYNLNVSKSIPYISKKLINDMLSDQILRKLYCETQHDKKKGFHAELLTKTKEALNTFHLLKGGAAVAAHLGETKPELSDIDIELFIDDKDYYTRVGLNNLSSFIPLPAIKKNVFEISMKYLASLKNILEDFDMSKLFSKITNDLWYDDDAEDTVTVFKSYINEAVQFDPTKVRLVVNEKMPFKITMSEVNNEYYLVRYSYNVHMISKIPNVNAIKLCRKYNVEDLQYFVFDLYFLDVSVKKSKSNYFYKKEHYFTKTLYGQSIVVECLENVISDQIECLMYNVFNDQALKVSNRMNRLHRLINKLEKINVVKNERRNNILIRKLDYCYATLNVRDIKQILFALGPALGINFLIHLHEQNRIVAQVEDITFQVNFPYHKWNCNYTKECCDKFVNCLKKLFQTKKLYIY